MRDVQNKKISVIGAAASGLAVAKLLMRKGAEVFVSDSSPAEKKQEASVLLQNEKIENEFGGHTDRVLKADFVVISPGVPGDIPIVKRIAEHKLPVFSEIEVASWWISCPVIAVTGSNGKTTTTTLIGEICKAAGLRTIVAGNIGAPLSEFTDERFDIAVIEISSFQAEGLSEFRPHIGLLLNLSPDHLDRYPSPDAYYQAKRRMLMNQTASDILICNADDLSVQKLVKGLRSMRWEFGGNASHAYVRDNALICRMDGNEETVINTEAIGIRGRHNIDNAMAATLAARAAGIPNSVIRKTLEEFKGVEHRLEFVREVRGVKFFNDSKATNVDSTFFALESFKKEKVVLIAGGKHKGAPYTQLTELVKGKVKKLMLIGQAADLIERDLGHLTTTERAVSIQEAVTKSFAAAIPGDVVLLSPACASYDMFKNYEDRGKQFKDAVHKLS